MNWEWCHPKYVKSSLADLISCIDLMYLSYLHLLHLYTMCPINHAPWTTHHTTSTCTNLHAERWLTVLHDESNEVFIHVFWECPKVQRLWVNFINWCKQNVSNVVTYSKEKCLLLGFEEPVLNIIMTICIYYIYCCKLFRTPLELKELLRRIDKTRVKDWLAYSELLYLKMSVIRKRWLPLTRINFSWNTAL